MGQIGRVFHAPWDLNRKGSLDQRRHAEKLKEAILNKLPEIVHTLPLEGGDTRVKIPLKVLDLPKFRPQIPKQPEDGVGQGQSKPGDIVAQMPRRGSGSGDVGPAGDAPGEHEIDVEIERDALISLVMEELKLPRLDKVSPPDWSDTTDAWNSRRDHGPWSTIDRRYTLKKAMMRSQSMQTSLNFLPSDVKYRAARDVDEPITRASVYFLRDISGSMGDERKFLSKAIAFWVTAWLRQQYPSVRIEWWVHDTDPTRLEEEALFFQLGEGGGTRVAPAYEAITEHIERYFPPSTSNNYVFHFTDGDVFSNDPVEPAAHQLASVVRWFGLVELVGSSGGTLVQQLQQLPHPPFRSVRLSRREDVLSVVRALLETSRSTSG